MLVYQKIKDRALHAKWVENLRSGEFEQGTQCLRSAENKFCCLGVFGDILVKQELAIWEPPVTSPTIGRSINYTLFSVLGGDSSFLGRATGILPDTLRGEIGLDRTAQLILTCQNDGNIFDISTGNLAEDDEGKTIKVRPKTFEEIADWVEANL